MATSSGCSKVRTLTVSFTRTCQGVTIAPKALHVGQAGQCNFPLQRFLAAAALDGGPHGAGIPHIAAHSRGQIHLEVHRRLTLEERAWRRRIAPARLPPPGIAVQTLRNSPPCFGLYWFTDVSPGPS